MTDTPPLADEEDLVAVAAERETLEEFLEYHRRALSGKLRGLSEEDARRRLVPSMTTMIGLVSDGWCCHRNASISATVAPRTRAATVGSDSLVLRACRGGQPV